MSQLASSKRSFWPKPLPAEELEHSLSSFQIARHPTGTGANDARARLKAQVGKFDNASLGSAQCVLLHLVYAGGECETNK
jgi:hypothetical protein